MAIPVKSRCEKEHSLRFEQIFPTMLSRNPSVGFYRISRVTPAQVLSSFFQHSLSQTNVDMGRVSLWSCLCTSSPVKKRWYNRSSSTEKDPRHLTLALQSEAGPRLPYLCGTSLSGLAGLIAGCNRRDCNHQFHR